MRGVDALPDHHLGGLGPALHRVPFLRRLPVDQPGTPPWPTPSSRRQFPCRLGSPPAASCSRCPIGSYALPYATVSCTHWVIGFCRWSQNGEFCNCAPAGSGRQRTAHYPPWRDETVGPAPIPRGATLPARGRRPPHGSSASQVLDQPFRVALTAPFGSSSMMSRDV